MASQNRDRLEVMVLEAQGLLAVEGGVANPYISVEVGDEKRRTAVEPNTVDPVWEEEIMVFSETTSRNMEHLVLMVKHNDPVGSYTDRMLGMVIVDTATALQAPGISTQEWFPVRKGPGMRSGDVPQGRVHVKVTYFVNSLEELERMDGNETDDDDDDAFNARVPNVVSLFVEAGRNLRPPGSKAACDPLVVVRCGGKSKQSKAQKRTNNPKWHFQVQMGNSDPNELVVIEVMHSGTMSNKLIGQARLTMVEIAQAGESLSKWLPLLDDRWGFDAVGRGEVVVIVRWYYDRDFDIKTPLLGASFMAGKTKKRDRERQALEAMVGEFEYEDDNDKQHQRRNEKKTTITGADEEQEEMDEEERMREKLALESRTEYQERLTAVKPGDYQLQVHVIEASDLKGKDSSGTSDPTVYVSCLGTTKHTRVRKGVNSAVFDEVLYFNLRALTRDQLMQATVQVRVLDANTFRRDSLIGSYQFDLLGIYVEKSHEVYRTWVGLQDTESGRETGVQGFLKLSVTVLGPGDRQRVHDLAEEIQEELAKEAEAGTGGKGGLVLLGPALIPQELRFLVLYVFSAQDLPGFSTVGVPSINALVQVDFAGNPPVRTTTVRAKGRDGLSPGWAQELWLPVMVPAHSTTIDLSVWHKEMTGRDVIAHAYFDFSDAPEMPGGSAGDKKSGLLGRRLKTYPGPPPVWLNLYGAPAGKGKGREAEMMNRYPSRGSTYRGRVLVAMRVEPRPPSKLGNRGTRSAMDFEVPPEILPETAKYTFRALVLQGSDIPVFKFPNAQRAAKMRVVVMLGGIKMEFRARSNKKGIVEWYQGDEVHMLELPADPAQIPDIIVYLVRDTPESRVSYARIPAVNVISQRFRGDPYWQELVADKTRQGLWAVGSDNFPGSLLIRLGLGRDAVARHNPWEEMLSLLQESHPGGGSPKTPQGTSTSSPTAAQSHMEGGNRGGEAGESGGWAAVAAGAEGAVDKSGALGLLGKKKPYCLRAHVFQCRGLPSSEASGLLDPYIKVRFMGRKQKTSHEGSTADPCFYQSVEFHEMLPGDLRFAPEIRVEVWDKDLLGSNTHVAGCRFPMSAATLSGSSGTRVPTPRWHQLRDTNGQPGVGEVLLSLQLIPKRTAHDKFPKAPGIAPTFRTAYLEVITLGVRDLRPYGFQAVAQPYVQFEMTSGGERVSFNTHASKSPSGKNANFAERKVKTVLLPDNPLFAPQLCIRVTDKRMSGLNNPVVGTCSVNIADKMPWNDNGYRPPQSQSFPNGTGTGGNDSPSSPTRQERRPAGRGGTKANGDGGDGGQTTDRDHDAHESKEEDSSVLPSASGEGDGGGLLTPDGSSKGIGNGNNRGLDNDGGLEMSSRVLVTRPANFGVGAVDIGDGGRGGADGEAGPGERGGGLELPRIEEDLVYEQEMAKLDLEFSRGRYPGGERARGGVGGGGQQLTSSTKAGGGRGGRQWSSKAPAWYEKLIQGGGKALGAVDTEEEDKWTLDELDIEFPHEWASSEFLEGRNWWLKREGGGNEIENFLNKAPFETYPLFLGAEKLKSGIRLFRQAPRRKVGILKGLVVVSENPPNPNNSEFVDMRLLRAPRSYCCRLYVVKCLHLQPKDINGLADPYLRLKIGKIRVDDGKENKENIKKATLNPDFFRAFEFQITMPGESQLKLKLYDYDRFGADELIGQTVIDLEDRWFSRSWHELEKQDSVASERREARGPFKPIEIRDLSVPSSGNPQGQVMMWLDILTLPEARRYPPVRMEPPAPLKVEVRVVCWRSEDVVACNDFSGLRDLYCRMWMETDSKKKRDTDTHWRCKNGKGSWNYRLKFDVELPLKSPEHGRMVVQMWDREVLSANDIIAETSIDLYRWFLKVYREQRSTKPFLIVKEARKQKAHDQALALAQGSAVAGGAVVGRGSQINERDFRDGGEFERTEEARRATSRRRRRRQSSKEGEAEGDDSGSVSGSNDDEDEEGAENHSGSDSETDFESDYGDEENKPLLDSRPGGSATATGPSHAAEGNKNAPQVRRADTDDTEEVINTVKDWFGIGRAPDDAQWLELTRRDPEAGTVERMGKLLISLELIPKETADAQPVGAGRNAPNQNPYLPPPAGRMKFSFNPFRLSLSLLGPKAFYKVLCCCLCVVVLVVFTLAGNYITAFESLF